MLDKLGQNGKETNYENEMLEVAQRHHGLFNMLRTISSPPKENPESRVSLIPSLTLDSERSAKNEFAKKLSKPVTF